MFTVKDMAIEETKANPQNVRTHSKRQIRQIAKSIEAFGFNTPVLVDETGMILAGHGRVEAARLLGLETIPTVRVDHMTAAQKRAFVIADNRLAEKAGWDHELLAIELEELSALDLDFEVEITGFETAEIDLLIGELENQKNEQNDGEGSGEEVLPLPKPNGPAISKAGDLFCLGRHRLLCGDACDPKSYLRLMRGERARVAITDPPYNVPIPGHVSGKGRHQHDDFAMACGEMKDHEFAGFLSSMMVQMAAHSNDGALHYVFMDWRHIGALVAAGELSGAALKNICVWVKDNGGMGSLYRSRHEFVCVFKIGTGRHINNVELGRFGRNRTNVWEYPGMNSLGAEDRDQLANHPTPKPVSMIADAILDSTRRGDIVLDPFLGSGTTVIAAEKTGRSCFALELDPGYVDAAIRRWQAWTGDDAVHEGSGATFDEMSNAITSSKGNDVPNKEEHEHGR
jgi:DNA modification methylase